MFRALFLSAALMGSVAPGDSLARYLWRSRVLVVFAPRQDDRRLLDQKAVVAGLAHTGDDRDLVFVRPAAGAQTERLRRRFAVDRSAFVVVLIGKDGGVKLKANEVIPGSVLAAVIDAMPMRQDELKRRSGRS